MTLKKYIKKHIKEDWLNGAKEFYNYLKLNYEKLSDNDKKFFNKIKL